MARRKTLIALTLCSILAPMSAGHASALAPTEAKAPLIIYSSNQTGDSELYAKNPLTQMSQRLTNNVAQDIGGAWSPDGQKIVFSSNRADGYHFQLYVMDFASKATTQLTQATDMNFVEPVWSPLGDSIAFTATSDQDTASTISTIRPDGTQLNILTRSKTEELHYPTWSPDGAELLVIGFGPGERTIYKTAAYGDGGLSVVAKNGFPAVYSPDGTKIAFSRRDQNFVEQVVVMNRDGSGERQITDSPYVSNRVADWSPDGSQLLVNAFVDSGGEVTDIGVRMINVTTYVQNDVVAGDGTAIYFSGEGSWR